MAIGNFSTSNYANFGTASQLALAGQMTISAWVYLNSTPAEVVYIASRWKTANGYRAWLLAIDTSRRPYLIVSPNGSTPTYSTTTSGATALALTTWSHVVARYNGSNICCFINGVATAAAVNYSSGIYNAANSLTTFGAGGHDASNVIRGPLPGNLCDVRCYGRALADAEITTIARAQGKDGILSSLALRTAILDGPAEVSLSGATIIDRSPYKNHVAATGAPTAKADPFGISRRAV